MNGENKKMCRPSSRSLIQRAIMITCETVGPSEDRRSAIDLSGNYPRRTYPDPRCSYGGLMERRKWPTP